MIAHGVEAEASLRMSSTTVLICHLSSTSVVPRLGVHRLRELEFITRDACCAMLNLCIPSTLIHNDFNGGNILLSDSRCVFTDWAEAGIGNPFLTFQHLCAQISRDSNKAGCLASLGKERVQENMAPVAHRNSDRPSLRTDADPGHCLVSLRTRHLVRFPSPRGRALAGLSPQPRAIHG
jgi:hypothetical protein